MAEVQNQDINQLLKVRREKLSALQENGKDPFQITKYNVTHHSTDIKDNYGELEGQEVSLAGRMMFKRVMGKASFCNIQDLKGRIQAYVARDNIGEDSYKDFKKYDVGDILGIRGTVFTTKTGEISIHAAEVTLLSKSLQILPEKFHGLTDTDTRYRQRYVDLIMNEEVKDTFVKRSKVISTIRRYLEATQTQPSDYDRIITGDLGAVGSELLLDLLGREQIDLSAQHDDCGLLIFNREEQDVHAGGSGCGCSASVLCAHLLNEIQSGRWTEVLFIPTGALMSTVSVQQGESIPGIAHLVHLSSKRWPLPEQE